MARRTQKKKRTRTAKSTRKTRTRPKSKPRRKATRKKSRKKRKRKQDPDAKPRGKGGAPKGNQFYLLREFQGRKKQLTPEELWKAFWEYYDAVKANPILIKEPLKSGRKAGKTMDVPTDRPLTLQGFAAHIGVTHHTLNNYARAKGYKAYFLISKRIRDIIYAQKFEGAAAGIFNHSIIERDLGLVDKSSHDVKMPSLAFTVASKKQQKAIEDAAEDADGI